MIHHSAVDRDNTAVEIASYHVNVLGWPGIGYHWLVHPDGRIEYVGDLRTVRYNVAKRNPEVIGICLPGDFTRHPPTDAALDSTRRLVAWLRAEPVLQAEVVSHGEIAVPGWETACCGATWPTWKPRIL